MIETQYSYTEYDALTYVNIKSELLLEDPQLYLTKWWDYKNLHALEATYLFAESYKRALKEAIKRRKCIYRGTNFIGLKDADFLSCSKRVITGMWKARQQADRLGIEYDYYCDQAMHYAEARDYTYLPSPTQLYSAKKKNPKSKDVTMIEHIFNGFEETKVNRLLHAQSAFYTITAYCKNRYQLEHQRFLISQIKNRASMKYLLVADLVYEKRLLKEQSIIDSIPNGEAILKQAYNFYK